MHAATGQAGLTSTLSSLPAATIDLPPAPPTAVDILWAGRKLGVESGPGESLEQFHARVRTAWQRLLHVVEG
jgi:hypothetical protein